MDYDESPSLVGSSLEAEYDATFTGEEKTAAALKFSSDAFEREFKSIKISEIVLSEPIKQGRKETRSGLTAITKDLGVLVPIHVMTLSEESQDDDVKYVLLDGLRRIYGALKNGQTEIDAIVWDFKDKDQGSDYALFISLLLNKTQDRSWGEKWSLFQVLEMQSAITPGTVEYLINLSPGDAMRFKDVMLAEYSEPKEALLSGDKDLDGAYKMLAKLRKEENALEKSDAQGISGTVEGAEDLAADNTGEGGELSDNDVLELLDMAEDLDIGDDTDEVEFKSLNAAEAECQKVGERHPLDPAIRQSVLARDKFVCSCCGMKMIGARLGLIAVHHKIPVHCGGRDSLDNLTTLCVNCHVALHIMERQGGSILMAEEDWNELYEKDENGETIKVDGKPKLSSEQISLLKARKLALVAIEADKRQGLSKDAVQKYTSDTIKHPMPGVAFANGKKDYEGAGGGA